MSGAAGSSQWMYSAGYEVDQSLRFNDGDDAYLSKTFGSAGNRQVWTYSVWIKLGSVTNVSPIFMAGDFSNGGGTTNNGTGLLLYSNGVMYSYWDNAAGGTTTSAIFRDPTAWYHICLRADAATDGNLKLYVNGDLKTTKSISGNAAINSAVNHNIGNYPGTGSTTFDGYMAEAHFIDGTALTPSSFGETGQYGEWRPIDYTGSHGSNGFYLPFDGNDVVVNQSSAGPFTVNDATTITRALGNDSSMIFSGAELTGDFDFQWEFQTTSLTPGDAYRVGVIPVSEFSSANYNSGLPTTNYWEITAGQNGSLQAVNNTDSSTNISGGFNNDSQFKMTRTSGEIKLFRADNLIHTFSTDSTVPMYMFFGSGDKNENIELNDIVFNDTDGSGSTIDLLGTNTVGGDHSGNANNWFPQNLSTSDIMKDSPTNNFCTLNFLGWQWSERSATMTQGNLLVGKSGADWAHANGTQIIPKNKPIYYEAYGVDASVYAGIALANANTDAYSAGSRPDGGYIKGLVSVYTDSNTAAVVYRATTTGTALGTQTFNGSGFSNAVVGVAVDQANQTVDFYVNGSLLNSSDLGVSACLDTTSDYVPIVSGNDTIEQALNFGADSSFGGLKVSQGKTDANGEGDFYYEPPSGYFALCTKTLDEPVVTPSDNFNTVLYTGNGSTNAITVGFQPDFVWGKDRSGTDHNHLFDAVRGTNQRLVSNATSAENTESNCLDSFDTNGFTLGSNTGLNNNNDLHVAWNWNMGGTTVSNTSGSITSSIRANSSAGQSIVTYTGTGSNATVGHGLASAPGFIVVKTRNNTGDWMVYYGDNTDFLKLNEYNDTEDLAAVWNDTSPTSSVFTIGTNTDVNVDGRTYVAYCFSSIDGYSSVGTYGGNAGSNETDGTFVYTGFRPAWVMCKLTSLDGESWLIKDNKRSPFNPADEWLYADKNSAEATAGTALRDIDFLSNGFKFRGWSTELNGDGESYTYLAFAETPFKYSNAR